MTRLNNIELESVWKILNNFHRFQNCRQFSNLFSQIRLKKRHTSLFSGICREIRTKIHQKFAEKMQNLTRKMKKTEIAWILVVVIVRDQQKCNTAYNKVVLDISFNWWSSFRSLDGVRCFLSNASEYPGFGPKETMIGESDYMHEWGFWSSKEYSRY